MISVKVDQLFLSNVGFVVLLKGTDDPRTLPIFIGAAEAQAIALWINKVDIPRPMTHDLLKSVLDCIECRLKRVEISDLKEGTFFAKLVLDCGGYDTFVDSRPSDAIALALRASAPISVAPYVMEEAGKVFEQQEEKDAKDSAGGKSVEVKEELSELDLLKQNLAKAISEERYEDAASFRDRINKLRSEHTSN